MNIPQPFQYQGSKRNLAPRIIDYFPNNMERLVEPFAGSGAISLACAGRGRGQKYLLNDFNQPLNELLGLIVNRPDEISDFYASIWRDKDTEHITQFYNIRDQFNETRNPRLLLYLLARCVKGAVRYNSDGQFNQSPDKRRLGTNPKRMRENISAVSMLLRGKTTFTSLDYREVFCDVTASDVVYMDPPYQGVCNTRDQRYSSGIEFDEFVGGLELLNRRQVRYLVSYDGRLGDKSYGDPLPECLDLVLVEIEAGRSSQATLLGQEAITIESLYLSRALADEVGATSAFLSNKPHSRQLKHPRVV
jgi:DNA adenine methylase